MKKIVILVLVLFLLLFFIKTESTVINSKVINIKYSNNEPAKNIEVKQFWCDYALESKQHFDKLKTDKEGQAFLPERKISVSLLERLYWRGAKLLLFWNPHISWEKDSYIIISTKNEEGSLILDTETIGEESLSLELKPKTQK